MNICGDKRKMGILKFYENEDDFDISWRIKIDQNT